MVRKEQEGKRSAQVGVLERDSNLMFVGKMSVLFILIFLSTMAFSQNAKVRVSHLDYDKVQIYGCNDVVEVKKDKTKFDFGECKVVDSIRLVGKDALFFDQYKWNMNDNELFINISLSYVDIESSYSVIFHNEKSIVWLVYELNGDQEWSSLIVPNCEGDNSHKKLNEQRMAPLAHVPEEFLHR